MSIEQTNQLILLILNSVLMMMLSAALLGGAWLRQNMLLQQLQRLRLRSRAIATEFETHKFEPSASHLASSHLAASHLAGSLKKMRSDRQRLSNQYLWSQVGMLTLHGVLLVFSVSLLALALRSLLSFDSLISTALTLFTVGSAGLLMGTSCILMDLIQGNSGGDSLGQSIGKTMSQLGHWWTAQTNRAPWIGAWIGAWKKEPIPLLISHKTKAAPIRQRATSGSVSTPPPPQQQKTVR